MNEMEGKELASFSQRILASSVDLILIMVISMIITSQTDAFAQMSALLQDANVINQLQSASAEQVAQVLGDAYVRFLRYFSAIYLSLRFGYLCIFLATSGSTLGCSLLKIRHVNIADFDSASWLQAAVKSLVFVLMESFFALLFLLAFFSPLRQSLADRISKQVVIREI